MNTTDKRITLESQGNDLYYVRVAVNYIQENYYKQIVESDIAFAAGTCNRNLRRIFKRHFSTTPCEFLIPMSVKKTTF